MARHINAGDACPYCRGMVKETVIQPSGVSRGVYYMVIKHADPLDYVANGSNRAPTPKDCYKVIHGKPSL